MRPASASRENHVPDTAETDVAIAAAIEQPASPLPEAEQRRRSHF